MRRPVLEDEDREPADCGVRVAGRQTVEERPVGVDVSRMVAREQLQREERRPAARRALVLEPAPEELELLAVAELADRAVRECALAEVLAARGALDLVLPLRPERRQLALGALVGELRRLGRG
ncbi:MAG TPA: hypothetical protein VH968_08105 [Gaiellaceae bacterium]